MKVTYKIFHQLSIKPSVALLESVFHIWGSLAPNWSKYNIATSRPVVICCCHSGPGELSLGHHHTGFVLVEVGEQVLQWLVIRLVILYHWENSCRQSLIVIGGLVTLTIIHQYTYLQGIWWFNEDNIILSFGDVDRFAAICSTSLTTEGIILVVIKLYIVYSYVITTKVQ